MVSVARSGPPEVLGYAGTNLSVPAQASAAPAAHPVSQAAQQGDALVFPDLLSAQVYSPDTVHRQEAARLLLQQLLLQSEQEEDEERNL